LSSFKLIMHVPLKSHNRYFELYRIIVFPERAFKKGFVKFELSKDYLAINQLRGSYSIMDHEDVAKCTGKTVKICRPVKPCTLQKRNHVC
jgi:hypothetical protein